jgi:hypothetical protein
MFPRPSPRRRGRLPAAIEQDPQRFEVACWWSFSEMGLGKFDAARRVQKWADHLDRFSGKSVRLRQR